MDLTADVDLSLLNQRIGSLIDAAVNPAEPLLRSGGLLRSRSRDRFEVGGPGWPALDPETLKRKANAAKIALFSSPGRGREGARSVLQRIARDAKGIRLWSSKQETLEQHLSEARAAGRRTAGIEKKIERAMVQQRTRIDSIRARRALVTAAGIKMSAVVAVAEREMARQKAHGLILRSYKKLKRAGYKFSVEERRAMTRQHQRRFVAQEESAGVLGALSRTIAMRLIGRSVKVFSKAHIGAIHNYGGTAGHGARIPARPFLFLNARDVAECAGIFSEYLQAAWELRE